MDWNTLLVATVPAMITGLIAYFSASSKTKAELGKAKLDQETALRKIESEQKTAIDTIERTAKNEIEKMRTATREEIEVYKAKSAEDLASAEKRMMLEQTGNFATGFLNQMFSGELTPEQATKRMQGIQKTADSMRKKTKK